MDYSAYYSAKTKEIIGNAAFVAYDLGHPEISVLHFILADCVNDHKISIFNFLFITDDEYQQFYNSQKLAGPPLSILEEKLPISKNAESTIRTSLSLCRNQFKDKLVQPHHLFLAASRISESEFYKILPDDKLLFEHLLEYYKTIGVIYPKKTGWIHLLRKLFQ